MSPSAIDKPVDRTVASYVAKPYTRMLVPDLDEGGFIAEILELPGCLSQGETPDEAFSNLDDAMEGYIASLVDRGYPVPEPVGDKEYSGRFLLRISSELHRAAATRAMHDGVSLNQWASQAIAHRLSTESIADEIVAKLTAALSVRLSTTAEVTVSLGGSQEVGLRETSPEEVTSWPRLLRIAEAKETYDAGG